MQSSGFTIRVMLMMSSDDAVRVWGELVQLKACCLISGPNFFQIFIYLFESSLFICDLTCIDEIKLC